jgi:hypothetical protein
MARVKTDVKIRGQMGQPADCMMDHTGVFLFAKL